MGTEGRWEGEKQVECGVERQWGRGGEEGS